MTPHTLRFGACPVGSARSHTIRVRNTGCVPVTWSLVDLADGFAASIASGVVNPPDTIRVTEVTDDGESKGSDAESVGGTACDGVQDVDITFAPQVTRKLYRCQFKVVCGARFSTVECAGFGGKPGLKVCVREGGGGGGGGGCHVVWFTVCSRAHFCRMFVVCRVPVHACVSLRIVCACVSRNVMQYHEMGRLCPTSSTLVSSACVREWARMCAW